MLARTLGAHGRPRLAKRTNAHIGTLSAFCKLTLYLAFCAALPAATGLDDAYDGGTNIFSPRGRLMQQEYAEEAVKRAGLCIGVSCSDGVVLASQRLLRNDVSALMGESRSRRIVNVAHNVAVLVAGLPADARVVAKKASDLAIAHKREYGEPIPGRVLADRLASHLQAVSIRWNVRSYAVAILVACLDDEDDEATPFEARQKDEVSEKEEENDRKGVSAGELYLVRASGALHRWKACAVGLGNEKAHKELKKWGPPRLTCAEVVEKLEELAREAPEGVRGVAKAELEVGTLTREGFKLLRGVRKLA